MTERLAKPVTLLVIRDGVGRIVATAHPSGRPAKGGLNVAVALLPGQTVEEYAVPPPVAMLASGPDLHEALARLDNERGGRRPPLRVELRGHRSSE
jgi:hypothetical protein